MPETIRLAAAAIAAMFLLPAGIAVGEPGRTVELQGLDKVTARTVTFQVSIGETVKFGALVITSCGDVSILNPADTESHTLEVISVSQGGTLNLGEPLVFSVSSPFDEEVPTRLDIKLVGGDGSVVASQSMDDPETDSDITVEFPDLGTGHYRIEFTLYGEDSVLLEKDLTFFYTTGSYFIHGIESFPPVNPPGSNVLLKVLLDVFFTIVKISMACVSLKKVDLSYSNKGTGLFGFVPEYINYLINFQR